MAPRTARLLFVCSGNLHRSVMAAGIARAMFTELNRPAIVASAGTLNLIGQTAPPEVLEVCHELGVDVSDHRSQGLSRTLVRNADAIIVMGAQHGESVLKLDASAEERLFHLGDYAEPPDDIWDPIGTNVARFRESRDHILGCLQRLLPDLLRRL